MYALLTYFLVILGSMGTGEDLFYKCCAPSEELSTHYILPSNFSLKVGIVTMSILFEKKLYFLLVDLLMYLILESGNKNKL